MAVKHRATDDERHAIELRALETTFERRVAEAAAEVAARLENRVEAESRETTSMLRALKQKVAKLQTQMNNRVFFGEYCIIRRPGRVAFTHARGASGANVSVHIEVEKLMMLSGADYDKVEFSGVQGYSDYKKSWKDTIPVTFISGSSEQMHGNYDAFLNPKHFASSIDLQAAVQTVMSKLYAADCEVIMPLPSASLMPLQLCERLQTLSVHGPQITSLDFLVDLAVLENVAVEGAQVRDLAPLATLPALRILAITKMDLQGGGEVDLEVLKGVQTLVEVSLCGSSAFSSISPLANIAGLKKLDITACPRVTDRRAFAAMTTLSIVPNRASSLVMGVC